MNIDNDKNKIINKKIINKFEFIKQLNNITQIKTENSSHNIIKNSLSKSKIKIFRITNKSHKKDNKSKSFIILKTIEINNLKQSRILNINTINKYINDIKIDNILPLYLFDDQIDYKQNIPLIIKENKYAYSKYYDNEGFYTWKKCEIINYIDKDRQFIIKFKHNNLTKKVSYLSVILSKDNISIMDNRYNNATNKRDIFIKQIKESIFITKNGLKYIKNIFFSKNLYNNILNKINITYINNYNDIINNLFKEILNIYAFTIIKTNIIKSNNNHNIITENNLINNCYEVYNYKYILLGKLKDCNTFDINANLHEKSIISSFLTKFIIERKNNLNSKLITQNIFVYKINYKEEYKFITKISSLLSNYNLYNMYFSSDEVKYIMINKLVY